MTDAEAIRSLTAIRHEHASCAVGWECLTCMAVRHALQAIADRESLCAAAWPERLPDGLLLRLDVARRHMKGEE